MSWGYLPGRTYNRRADIHARYSGQRQGGIITPASHNLVIVITGETGVRHGYGDRVRPDGVFEYFGEGQVGDMQMARGNKKILEHTEDGRDLLVFRKTTAGLRFEGEYVCQGFHHENAPDTEGNDREAIVFELVPLETVAEKTAEVEPATDALGELRLRAYDAAKSNPNKRKGTTTVYQRSQSVRDYVLARAGGICEHCKSPAPFSTPSGFPFLEVHHIRRLTDGGPDDPRYLIGICPNCHRRAHHSADKKSCNEAMLNTVLETEADLNTSTS